MAGKPKPTHLKLIRGNPGRRPLPKNEPIVQADLKGPPAYFNEAQRAIWNKAIADAPPTMLRCLDWSQLAAWTVACSLHAEACRKLDVEGMIVETRGQPIQNPVIAIINRQALLMMRANAELGFSPVSRSKVQVVKVSGGTSALDEFAS